MYFIVHTNEGQFYVRNVTKADLQERMKEYIKDKRSKGMSLSDITYCWAPIHWSSLP